MKRILRWFIETSFYKFILLNIIPFIRLSVWYPKVNGRQFLTGYSILKPGDIILTIDEHKLTTLLIPGTWSHAEVCVGKGTIWETSGMTHKGYTKHTFFDVCKESDRFAIFRIAEATPEYIEEFIRNVKSFDGADYDVTFSLGVKTLYCSELPYQADTKRLIGADLSDIVGLGTPYISPQGLAEARGLRMVFDSAWIH